jgi:uncharacterized protein (DUF58 family)
MRQTSAAPSRWTFRPLVRPFGWLRLGPLLNYRLAPNVRIDLRLRWPLVLLAICLLGALLMPDPVWSTATLALAILYVGGYLWVRTAAAAVQLERRRTGTLLVVGDTLEEEFVLVNDSSAPLAWVEIVDDSTLPGYAPGRVVDAGAGSRQRWRSSGLCSRRGRVRLGPHRLISGDAFSLFRLTIDFPIGEELVIYPRVPRLPPIALPGGERGGEARSRRPLFGVQPAPSVRGYQPHDDLRYIHWPATARHGALMVRELELEPVGDLWILLDSSAAAIQSLPAPPPTTNTLESAITLCAGVAASLLEEGSARGVGLLAASGEPAQMITIAPQRQRAHLWSILAALAPLEPAPVRLADLLAQARELMPSRSSLLVVTADLVDSASIEAWTARLVGLRERGFFPAALLVTTPESEANAAGAQALLARYRIEATLLSATVQLPAALTHRRRRKLIRTSPLGGSISVEVEEEVG